uniref:GH18 domain-containing protein n=1 Tax=Stomoxys calcitrans TaxID=35570 RepID=A0A1I8P921_STOCA
MKNSSFLILTIFFFGLEALETDKMINCYLRDFRSVDKVRVRFKGIDPKMCTHISFAFYDLAENGSLKVPHHAPDKDLTSKLVMENPDLKLIAVVGGVNVSTQLFSAMAADEVKRRNFRKSVIVYLLENGFNGLDIHWLNKSNPADRPQFVTLLSELSESFSNNDLELGISTIAELSYIRSWYDISNIVKYVDFINVMAYNYTRGRVDHDSALYGNHNGNAHATINLWLTGGAPASKLNLGVSFIGHHFDEIKSKRNKFKVKAPISYFDAFQTVKRYSYQDDGLFGFDLNDGRSYLKHVGIWQWKWTSYESGMGVEMKMDYVQEMGLRGVMIWTHENEQFEEKIGEYRLLGTISRKLDSDFECLTGICCAKSKTVQKLCYFIWQAILDFPTAILVLTSNMNLRWLSFLIIVSTLSQTLESIPTEKRIHCYYGSWATHRPNGGDLKPENIDPFLCTHIHLAFFGISPRGLFTSDIDTNLIEKLNNFKWKYPQLKLIAVLGGPDIIFNRLYRFQIGSPETRMALINSTLDFLLQHKFDGLDLYFKYGKQQISFVRDAVHEFKMGFEGQHLEVGVTVYGRISYAHHMYDVQYIGQSADFINVMAYNYTGEGWTYTIGDDHVRKSASRRIDKDWITYDAPLYGRDDNNVKASIDYWLDNGAPPSKINLGVAFVGINVQIEQSLALETRVKSIGSGLRGFYTWETGHMAYIELCRIQQRLQQLKNGTVETNSMHKSTIMQYRNYWWSYESPMSLEAKMDYLAEKNLGGVMVWSLENDDFLGRCGVKFPLLKYISRRLDDNIECTPGRCCIKTTHRLRNCRNHY